MHLKSGLIREVAWWERDYCIVHLYIQLCKVDNCKLWLKKTPYFYIFCIFIWKERLLFLTAWFDAKFDFLNAIYSCKHIKLVSMYIFCCVIFLHFSFSHKIGNNDVICCLDFHSPGVLPNDITLIFSLFFLENWNLNMILKKL